MCGFSAQRIRHLLSFLIVSRLAQKGAAAAYDEALASYFARLAAAAYCPDSPSKLLPSSLVNLTAFSHTAHAGRGFVAIDLSPPSGLAGLSAPQVLTTTLRNSVLAAVDEHDADDGCEGDSDSDSGSESDSGDDGDSNSGDDGDGESDSDDGRDDGGDADRDNDDDGGDGVSSGGDENGVNASTASGAAAISTVDTTSDAAAATAAAATRFHHPQSTTTDTPAITVPLAAAAMVTPWVVVSFSGTDFLSLRMWLDDASFAPEACACWERRCPGCRAHRGFWETYLEVALQIKTAVVAALEAYPGAALAVTGHSLGAALALLCAIDLASTPLLAPGNGSSDTVFSSRIIITSSTSDGIVSSTGSNDVSGGSDGAADGSGAGAASVFRRDSSSSGSGSSAGLDRVDATRVRLLPVYTFGQPRVGNAALSEMARGLGVEVFRVTHGRDPVVHLPYAEVKPGAGILESSAGELFDESEVITGRILDCGGAGIVGCGVDTVSGSGGSNDGSGNDGGVVIGGGYRHVPQEVFYDVGARVNAGEYALCDGSGEDKRCANRYCANPLNAVDWLRYHCHYGGVDFVQNYVHCKIGAPDATAAATEGAVTAAKAAVTAASAAAEEGGSSGGSRGGGTRDGEAAATAATAVAVGVVAVATAVTAAAVAAKRNLTQAAEECEAAV